MDADQLSAEALSDFLKAYKLAQNKRSSKDKNSEIFRLFSTKAKCISIMVEGLLSRQLALEDAGKEISFKGHLMIYDKIFYELDRKMSNTGAQLVDSRAILPFIMMDFFEHKGLFDLRNDELSIAILNKIKILDSMTSDEYLPPNDINEVIRHFLALTWFYSSLALFRKKPPENLLQKIDFSHLFLVMSAAKELTSLYSSGINADRVHKSIKSKQNKRAAIRQGVIEEYHKLDRIDDLSPHSIAKRIWYRLGKSGKKQPHTDTIKKYLKEEGLFPFKKR